MTTTSAFAGVAPMPIASYSPGTLHARGPDVGRALIAGEYIALPSTPAPPDPADVPLDKYFIRF